MKPALALLPSLGAGLLIGLAAWPAVAGSTAERGLRAALALGVALGVASLLFFLGLVLCDARAPGLLLVDGAGVGVAIVLYAWRHARWAGVGASAGPRAAPTAAPLRPALWLVAALVAAGSLAGFVAEYRTEPHGGWDAWAVWNLRARFLGAAGAQWDRAFAPALQHADYPLLLPALVARAWHAAQTHSPLVPAAVAGCYALATVGLAAATVALLRGSGAAALVALTALPAVSREAAKQYADIPLAFYLVAANAALLCRHRYGVQASSLAATAGLCAGLAAFTKDEGLLFLIALAAAELVHAWRSRRWTPPLLFGLAAAPGTLGCLYFKRTLAPASELYAQQNLGDLLAKLVDPGRYLPLFGALATEATRASSLPYWAMLAYLLLAGRRTDPSQRDGAVAVAVGLALIVAGFGFVYVTTPYQQAWHLANSLDRLLVQLLPSVLVLGFSIAARPAGR